MATYEIDDEIEETAKRLEAEGKITEEACLAFLDRDRERYWEAMRLAAEDVLLGGSPHFLSKSEIADVAEIYGTPLARAKSAESDPPPTYDPPRYDPPPTYNPYYANEPDDLSMLCSGVWGLSKWIFAIGSGAFVPYAGYKLAKACVKEALRSK